MVAKPAQTLIRSPTRPACSLVGGGGLGGEVPGVRTAVRSTLPHSSRRHRRNMREGVCHVRQPPAPSRLGCALGSAGPSSTSDTAFAVAHTAPMTSSRSPEATCHRSTNVCAQCRGLSSRSAHCRLDQQRSPQRRSGNITAHHHSSHDQNLSHHKVIPCGGSSKVIVRFRPGPRGPD